MYLSHRIAWVIHNGKIPKGLCVLHHCDNPSCCNPKHLFVGTVRDNNIDCALKDRYSSAKLTEAQADEIRVKYKTDTYSQRELAIMFGVCQDTISSIVRGKTHNCDNRVPFRDFSHQRGGIGEKHSRAKLTWEDVDKIRELYSQGNITLKELAVNFKVAQTTLSAIITFKTWQV